MASRWTTDARAARALWLGVVALLAGGCAAGKAALDAPLDGRVEIQGHRGCRGLKPENTWPAFAHAIDLGVDVLELDVCLSADGQVVVSHEPWMDLGLCRPQGGAAPSAEGRGPHFGELPYRAISAWDCGSWGNPRFPEQEPVATAKPLLREVLLLAETRAASLGRAVGYNVEIKARPEWDGVEQPSPEAVVPVVLEVLRATGVRDRTTLQSFDHRVLRLARAADPGLRLVLLEEANPLMGRVIDRLGFEPWAYSPWHPLVTKGMVREAHRRGIRLIPWTVNEPADLLRLRALGVDGLITDYPDRALALPPR